MLSGRGGNGIPETAADREDQAYCSAQSDELHTTTLASILEGAVMMPRVALAAAVDASAAGAADGDGPILDPTGRRSEAGCEHEAL